MDDVTAINFKKTITFLVLGGQNVICSTKCENAGRAALFPPYFLGKLCEFFNFNTIAL